MTGLREVCDRFDPMRVALSQVGIFCDRFVNILAHGTSVLSRI